MSGPTLALILIGVAIAAALAGARFAVAWWDRRVARAVHEIRGPLAAAGLTVELARRACGSPGQPADPFSCLTLEHARIAEAVRRLERSERRQLSTPAARSRVPLRLLAERCVDASLASALRCGARMVLEDGAADEAEVDGDPVSLSQGLRNLIDNAFEHGRPVAGGEHLVRIAVRRFRGVVRVSVSDNGPGFSERLPPRARGLRRRDRGHGLSVAATIATAHGGRLVAVPAAAGACLALELPPGSAGGARTPGVPLRPPS